MSDLTVLKGKTLKSVSSGRSDGSIPESSGAYGGVHGQNRDTVTFHCEDGDYVFLADGDCCSRTFVNSIEGPTEGLIADVFEPEETRSEGDDEVTKYYRGRLTIEGKGYLDVEYRNESNGYYGGSLELLSAPTRSEGEAPR